VASADGAPRPAAFFDLDKTVIAKASMVAFSRPLHRAGMLPRRMMLKAAWGQLVYAQIGATPEKLEKLRETVLGLTKGWVQSEVSEIVRATLEEIIEPIVFDEALERIRHHQAQGHKVFIVSASPEEVVAPIAQLLGVDEAIATRAELDDEGRYSGRTERYVYGPEKEVAILEAAARDHLDLAESWAYSDSATDVPMLSAVGHPVAVNPDRELAKVAREKGWEIEQFALEVRLRDRVPMPSPKQAGVGGGAAVLGAAAVAGWLWWRRRTTATPPTRAQALLTFLTARKARPPRSTSSSSFFMGSQGSHAIRDRLPALRR
jgi:HAD superfamily hydrolase (TIGR01490 family)